MRFYPLEKLINLREGYSRQFKIDNLQLLLVQHLDEHFVFEAHCPHRAHPLNNAVIEGGRLRCPLHQYQFSLTDGRVIHATEASCRALRTYPVVYEGNEIGIVLDDQPV